MDEWQTNDCRDINWAVNFEVTVNGMEVSFDSLTDSEKEIMLEIFKCQHFVNLCKKKI